MESCEEGKNVEEKARSHKYNQALERFMKKSQVKTSKGRDSKMYTTAGQTQIKQRVYICLLAREHIEFTQNDLSIAAQSKVFSRNFYFCYLISQAV